MRLEQVLPEVTLKRNLMWYDTLIILWRFFSLCWSALIQHKLQSEVQDVVERAQAVKPAAGNQGICGRPDAA
jgi:hypothetical protein